MGDMSSAGIDFLVDRKGPTMTYVEVRVVDGVTVVSHSRVLHRIADSRGAHHNNLQHIHGCDYGIRHSGGHRGRTLCFNKGGGGDIVKQASTGAKISNIIGTKSENIVDT